MSVVAAVEAVKAASMVSVIVTCAVSTPVAVGVTAASMVVRLVPALIELEVDVHDRTVAGEPESAQFQPEVLGVAAKNSPAGNVAVTVGALLVAPPVERTDAFSARV